jgi:hypothetical protein
MKTYLYFMMFWLKTVMYCYFIITATNKEKITYILHANHLLNIETGMHFNRVLGN